MTLLEEIKCGENAALEFMEARPNDSLKFTKTVVAFANGKGGRLIFGIENGTRILDANDDNHNIRSKGNEDNREDNEDNGKDNEDKDALVLNAIARNPQLTVRQLAANLPISKPTVEHLANATQGREQRQALRCVRGRRERGWLKCSIT